MISQQKSTTGVWKKTQRRYIPLDTLAIQFARQHGITLLRISIGIVYVWFGALKLWPGLSPAEPLVRATMERFVPMALFLPFLACWEMAIGLGFIWGRFPRVTIGLMLLQMVGAMSPLFLLPDRIFAKFPLVFTLEGQYVFKDIILVSADLVIAAATMHRMSLDMKRVTTTMNQV